MNTDYEIVASTIRFIKANYQSQPELDEIAQAVHLSPYHLQRLFRRWAGVSPKRFLQFITVDHAKKLLASSVSVLDTSLEVGLSSPGRLHDHFVQLEAMTPGEYKTNASSLPISYGFGETPFGIGVIAFTERGICRMSLTDDSDDAVQTLKTVWPAAEWKLDQNKASKLLGQIFTDTQAPLKLSVSGTNFQINVWKALLKIPRGHVWSYQQLAKFINKPSASRAVANAIGANPVAFLIPCHRVIRGEGEIGGYRWSPLRKQAILGWEASHNAEETPQQPQVALPGI